MLAALPAEPRYDPRTDTLESLDARLLSLTCSSTPSAAPSPALPPAR
jgi:hypothetical protein